MSNDSNATATFPDGLVVKAPHARAPDFVKARLAIKREAMIAWLQGQADEWINLDVKASRSGTWYAAIDSWKPEKQEAPKADPRPADRQAAA